MAKKSSKKKAKRKSKSQQRRVAAQSKDTRRDAETEELNRAHEAYTGEPNAFLPDVDDSLENIETDEQVLDTLPTDTDGYIVPPEAEESGTVVVEDFDPANPGQELAEPVKVLRTDLSRHQRKSMQRKNLDKS